MVLVDGQDRASRQSARLRCYAAVASLLAAALVAPARAGAATPPPPPPPPPSQQTCLKLEGVPCYRPAQLHRAYDVTPLLRADINGRGTTIVIVDAFGSPTISNDLQAFDQAFGLPNPRLRILQPVGQVPPFNPKNGLMVQRAGETTLDVELAHAMAPRAEILLVETPTAELPDGAGFPQYMAAERYVIRRDLGDVISQSFSLPEQNFTPPNGIRRLRQVYELAARDRVTVLAATNDFGVGGPTATGAEYQHRVVYWPASDPLVTAVGGTQLHLDPSGRRTSPDTVWNDGWNRALWVLFGGAAPPYHWVTGGGVSKVFARPWYQRPVRGIVGGRRGIPDVSLSASYAGPALVYQTYPGANGWGLIGGTSEATPELAGIVALADQYGRERLHRRRLGLINPALYRLMHRRNSGLVDITRGNNSLSFFGTGGLFTLRGYRAKRGYDLASGLGTIDAARLVPALARAASGRR